VLIAFIVAGDRFTNSKNYRANFWISNWYSNSAFTLSKEAFIRNFEVMNRRFTEAEVGQFL
jgi:hypothetical protein